jgi:predicted TIM-barrel fold metal-dependent hydrolase
VRTASRDGAEPAFEPALEPDVRVIDAHHHLFEGGGEFLAAATGHARFNAADYAGQLGGHRVVATVAVEAHADYVGAGSTPAARFVAETSFLRSQAEAWAAAHPEEVRIGAAIVGQAELRQGAAVRDELEAQLAVAPDRFRGVRQEAMWDADADVLGGLHDNPEHLYRDAAFREGLAVLAEMGLSFDAFVLAPQLGDIVGLARAFPGLSIILNHVGQPVGVGRHSGRTAAAFAQWEELMAMIAACPNVSVKLGGLGAYLGGSPSWRADPPVGSVVLAEEWRPRVESTIGLFGADRVMFESNLPTDAVGDFAAVCNAFKRITRGCSADEKRAIFAGTADRVYRMGAL